MAKNVSIEAQYIGDEPTFNAEEQLSREQTIKALNWYNYMKEGKDAKKYLIEALKETVAKDVLKGIEKLSDEDVKSVGFVARMIQRGAVLPDGEQATFECALTGIIAAAETEAERKTAATDENATPKKVVNIQERIKVQADRVIAECEAELDKLDFDVAAFKQLLMDSGVKAPQAKHILEWVESKKIEFTKISKSKDEQVKEAWGNYGKGDFKVVLSILDDMAKTVETIVAAKKAARKPRAKKAKPVEQVVGAVKYCKSFSHAVSINPKEIVGALQLWTFNIKTRKLGVFHADSEQGLTVKGTTVKSFDETKSISKTVRKPEIKIPELLKAGKVALRKFMDEIKAKPSVLKGRLNEDTVLLKVVK
jgi:hypothetical protein